MVNALLNLNPTSAEIVEFNILLKINCCEKNENNGNYDRNGNVNDIIIKALNEYEYTKTKHLVKRILAHKIVNIPDEFWITTVRVRAEVVPTVKKHDTVRVYGKWSPYNRNGLSTLNTFGREIFEQFPMCLELSKDSIHTNMCVGAMVTADTYTKIQGIPDGESEIVIKILYVNSVAGTNIIVGVEQIKNERS
jgi:hypothetical protein